MGFGKDGKGGKGGMDFKGGKGSMDFKGSKGGKASFDKGGKASSLKRQGGYNEFPAPAKVRRTMEEREFEFADILERNGVQHHALESFWALPPDLQCAVIDAGPLEDARDATAVLLSRINKVNAGGSLSGPPPTKGGYRNMPLASSPAVEDFLVGIDPSVADWFRRSPPEMQEMVMEIGPLQEARDPTAVLVSRLKKAEQGTLAPPQMKPGDWKCPKCGDLNFARNQACRKCFHSHASDSARVEDFLAQNGVEKHAATSFRDMPTELQNQIMDVGNLQDARDPTAVLISRMAKARRGDLNVIVMKPGDWRCPACGDHNFARNEVCRNCAKPHEGDTARVEAFLSENDIQSHAVESFREIPIELQNQIMDMGSLQFARDPTAVLISRMARARRGEDLSAPPMKPGDWVCEVCGDHNFARNESCRSCNPGQSPAKGTKGPPPRDARYEPKGGAKGKPIHRDRTEEFEDVLGRSGVQPRARDMFWELSPDLQSYVIDAGGLEEADDPSRLLMSRIRDAQRGGLPAEPQRRQGAWKRPRSPAEDFLAETPIDPQVAEWFRGSHPEVQELVMMAGSLLDARDPTACLVSRIKKAEAGELRVPQMKPGDWRCPSCGEHNFARNEVCRRCNQPGDAPVEDFRHEAYPPPSKGYSRPQSKGYSKGSGYAPPTSARAEKFLDENRIDPEPAKWFRSLEREIQNMVMDAGGMQDARDPSAVLVTRIKKAMDGSLVIPQMKPGDWTCPACGDHNFARNQACRKCFHSNASDSTRVEEFISENGIEEHAAESFREMPTDLQNQIMDLGTLTDARDATAVLISRMSKARRGQLNAPQIKEGDWHCPACGDHNFARNEVCRKCNEPKAF
eukprot:TRINITY_DN1623_c0_g1_i1.p1 TRINITY_DN1623_c0_g1~~TRINITY_DN1623_c0_g1_i1.p1  ORF type:complete len:865 (-),score=163.25 TRINITY_DN1623_c0_g1_i1:176-2740(-)